MHQANVPVSARPGGGGTEPAGTMRTTSSDPSVGESRKQFVERRPCRFDIHVWFDPRDVVGLCPRQSAMSVTLRQQSPSMIGAEQQTAGNAQTRPMRAENVAVDCRRAGGRLRVGGESQMLRHCVDTTHLRLCQGVGATTDSSISCYLAPGSLRQRASIGLRDSHPM